MADFGAIVVPVTHSYSASWAPSPVDHAIRFLSDPPITQLVATLTHTVRVWGDVENPAAATATPYAESYILIDGVLQPFPST